MEKTMEKIVQVAKARGFVYPGSEIYGGLANTWDYGNLGVELKNNVKRAWWQKFIQENPYNVERVNVLGFLRVPVLEKVLLWVCLREIPRQISMLLR